MKVTKEEDGFKPITIVLETKEEADVMWLCLNVAESTLQDLYGYLRSNHANKTRDNMWWTLNGVYKYRGSK